MATALALGAACAPVNTRLLPDPVAPGRVQLSFGADALLLRDEVLGTVAPSVLLDVGARYGVAEDLDLGVRLSTFGLEGSLKWRFLGAGAPAASTSSVGAGAAGGGAEPPTPAGARWTAAIAPALQLAGVRETDATTKALLFFAELPLIVGVDVADSARLGFGPRVVYGLYRPVTGGESEGLTVGGLVNLDLQPVAGWHLIPSLGLDVAVHGDVPVAGWTGSLGAGAALDL